VQLEIATLSVKDVEKEKCQAKNCDREGKYALIGLPALIIRDMLKMDLDDELVVCNKHFAEAQYLTACAMAVLKP